MDTPNGTEVPITQHTYMRVKVTNKGRPVKWNGRFYQPGETFEAKQYEMKPAIKAGQVEMVAMLPGFDPQKVATEIVPGEPPADE